MRMAKVQFGGISKRICLEYVPEAEIGDYVLVHVGFALARIDEEEAKRFRDAGNHRRGSRSWTIRRKRSRSIEGSNRALPLRGWLCRSGGTPQGLGRRFPLDLGARSKA